MWLGRKLLLLVHFTSIYDLETLCNLLTVVTPQHAQTTTSFLTLCSRPRWTHPITLSLGRHKQVFTPASRHERPSGESCSALEKEGMAHQPHHYDVLSLLLVGC